VQSQDNVEDFLRSVFGFLKRNTSYMATEGSDKSIQKVAREFQLKNKVRFLIVLGGRHGRLAHLPTKAEMSTLRTLCTSTQLIPKQGASLIAGLIQAFQQPSSLYVSPDCEARNRLVVSEGHEG
jgi:hypothetical protein